jgi:hypothetical protein
MALDKEQAQGIIDDFVFSNDNELYKIASENKALFNATINALDFLSKRFGTAQEISKDRVLQMAEVVKEDELPFKEGDNFKVKNEGNSGYIIKEINGNEFYFERLDDGTKYKDIFTTDEAKQKFIDGKWVKFEEEKPIRKFNIGDKFNVNKTILNFTIDFIKDTDVGIIYDDGLTAIVEINQFADGIISGYYKPIAKKIDRNIGDLTLDTKRDKIYEIEEIDNSGKMVKFVSDGSSSTRWTPFSVFDSNIKDGSFKSLSFKTGDTFKTKSGGTVDILSRNGNVFDLMYDGNTTKRGAGNYTRIQSQIELGEWTKMVLPDLSQAQPNATQQMMAKATATPIMTASSSAPISAKLPKKTLSKDEKTIKTLQKEIDGLELIAEFDEEAKTELEKKQAEIKALKSKIS